MYMYIWSMTQYRLQIVDGAYKTDAISSISDKNKIYSNKSWIKLISLRDQHIDFL